MDVRILGPLEVWEGSEQLVIDSPRQRSLLALLAICANEVVSGDRIVDELWGESPPASAQSAVRYHVSMLRSSLGGAAKHVVTRSPGYVLEVDADNIDANRFETMAAEGRGLVATEPERAARVLVEGLGMWRGTPLADFTYESFARSEILRLEELRLAVVEDRIEADLASGRYADLIGELEALVTEYPLRERLWGQWMRALYGSGRQAEALRAYQLARQALGEVGIEPSEELQAVEERVLQQDPLLLPLRRRRGHNLPERISSFVGREREIAEVRKLVEHHRLVTLTGIGGVGKTSLAVEALRGLVDGSADEAWFVAISDISDGGSIPGRLAQVLGVQIRTEAGLVEQLADHLSERACVVIFDACERYVDQVAQLVHRLLTTASQLSVVATSRVPLEIAGECRFEVSPLAVVGIGSEAVQLFTARASAAYSGFEIAAGDTATLDGLCQRLAGIPLAIELAAARLSALSLDQIVKCLDDQMTLLVRGSPDRSQNDSLLAVLDWNHDQLTTEQQILLRRLAVFAGSFALEAAEHVCTDDRIAPRRILDLLICLVDFSLVIVDRDTNRYHLLDPVQQYADRRLEAAGESQLLRRRHVDYFRSLAKDAFDGRYGPDESKWMTTCTREETNDIAAITWALDNNEPRLAIDIAAYLTDFWDESGRVAAEDRLLGSVLEQATQFASRELVILLTHACFVEYSLRNTEEAVRLGAQSLEVARELDDPYSIGRALRRLGGAVFLDLDRAIDYTRQAIDTFRSIQHPEALKGLHNLVAFLCERDDTTGKCLTEAEQAAQEMLALAQDIQSMSNESHAYRMLTKVAWYRGDVEQARQYIIKGIAIANELDSRRWVADALGMLALIELDLGNVEGAVAHAREFAVHRQELWGDRYLLVEGRVKLAIEATRDDGVTLLLDALAAEAPRDPQETSRILFHLATACAQDNSVAATRLHAAAETLRTTNHLAIHAHIREQLNEHLTHLREVLGYERYEMAWAEGAAMNIDEVVAFARDALSPREAEIAATDASSTVA